MRTRRKILAVMAISGAIAGLGGASQIGDFAYTLDGSPTGLQAAAFGYTGIVVAALARYNPFAVCLVAVLIGGLLNAGYTLQGPDFPSGLVGVMQGIILFCALGGEVLLRYRLRIRHGSRDGEAGRPEAARERQRQPARHRARAGGALRDAASLRGARELLAERSGVLNLGVEGMMLFGAVVGFWVTQRVERLELLLVLFSPCSPSAIAGAAMAAIHAFLVITLRANQIVSGLALTIFAGGLGLSAYFGTELGISPETPVEAAVRLARRARPRGSAGRRPDPVRPVRARLRVVGSDAPRRALPRADAFGSERARRR